MALQAVNDPRLVAQRQSLFFRANVRIMIGTGVLPPVNMALAQEVYTSPSLVASHTQRHYIHWSVVVMNRVIDRINVMLHGALTAAAALEYLVATREDGLFALAQLVPLPPLPVPAGPDLAQPQRLSD